MKTVVIFGILFIAIILISIWIAWVCTTPLNIGECEKCENNNWRHNGADINTGEAVFLCNGCNHKIKHAKFFGSYPITVWTKLYKKKLKQIKRE